MIIEIIIRYEILSMKIVKDIASVTSIYFLCKTCFLYKNLFHIKVP